MKKLEEKKEELESVRIEIVFKHKELKEKADMKSFTYLVIADNLNQCIKPMPEEHYDINLYFNDKLCATRKKIKKILSEVFDQKSDKMNYVKVKDSLVIPVPSNYYSDIDNDELK